MNEVELTAIKERAEAATPAPWEYDGQHDEITAPYAGPERPYWLICSECRATPHDDLPADEFGHQYNPDFEFIAAARTDVPALVSECWKLRETLGQTLVWLRWAVNEVESAPPELSQMIDSVQSALGVRVTGSIEQGPKGEAQ